MTCRAKDRLPKDTPAARAVARKEACLTPFQDAPPYAWTDRSGLAVREQTRVGSNGYAVTLLRLAEQDDDANEDDDDLMPELDGPRFR